MGKRGEGDPALVDPGSWDALCGLVASGWDMGTRELCQVFQASRSWVAAHVRPHVPHVYVSPKWHFHLACRVPSVGLACDETLYDRAALRAWALEGARFEARTRLVLLDDFVRPDAVADLRAARKEFREAADRSEAERTCEAAAAKLAAAEREEKCLAASLDEAGASLLAARADETRRAEAPWVAVDPAEASAESWPGPAARWRTAADRRGYGDTDEEVHRHLFRSGAVRVTMPSCGRVMYADQLPGPPPRWGADELPVGPTSIATVRRDAWDRIGAPIPPEARGPLGSIVGWRRGRPAYPVYQHATT